MFVEVLSVTILAIEVLAVEMLVVVIGAANTSSSPPSKSTAGSVALVREVEVACLLNEDVMVTFAREVLCSLLAEVSLEPIVSSSPAVYTSKLFRFGSSVSPEPLEL